MRLAAITRSVRSAPLRSTTTSLMQQMKPIASSSISAQIPRGFSTLSQFTPSATNSASVFALASTPNMFTRRLLQNASSAAPLPPSVAKSTANAEYSYSNPPPKPKSKGAFFSTLGKAFLALLIVPALLSIVFPSLLAFLIPAATLLTIAAVLTFTVAIMFGFVFPLLAVTLVSVTVPAAVVYSELNKMRNAKQFDGVAWEIIVPKRDFHVESSSHGVVISSGDRKGGKKSVTAKVDNDNSDSADEFTRKAEAFFVDIGAIVETEIMRRDLMGHVDLAGSYPRVVAIRGKNVGFLGNLMNKVEIPIDRDWVRVKVAERLAADKK
ncbi:hypothetical protein BJ741DRAFT_631747 [Chytriomyces cf. hyalinus JEL632]|nr:hypothetical protein BJ741DRAFT_631747 [Chytriomyces cf. hyalinus JEL632]